MRRWLVLVLACLLPLQSIHAVSHDYSDHATRSDGAGWVLFHTHDADADRDGHHHDAAHNGDAQHDGETGHSHAPHVPLLLTLPALIAPTLHPRLPSARPPIYLSAIAERLDRPPHPARR